MNHALIVDDDVDTAQTLAALVAEEAFTVSTAATLRDARRQMALQSPEIVLLDLQLPDTTGFAVAQEIAGDFAVVITSTHDDEDIGAMARRSGACGFVSKSELSGAAIEQLLP